MHALVISADCPHKALRQIKQVFVVSRTVVTCIRPQGTFWHCNAARAVLMANAKEEKETNYIFILMPIIDHFMHAYGRRLNILN